MSARKSRGEGKAAKTGLETGSRRIRVLITWACREKQTWRGLALEESEGPRACASLRLAGQPRRLSPHASSFFTFALLTRFTAEGGASGYAGVGAVVSWYQRDFLGV